jgi:hypothetical protein
VTLLWTFAAEQVRLSARREREPGEGHVDQAGRRDHPLRRIALSLLDRAGGTDGHDEPGAVARGRQQPGKDRARPSRRAEALPEREGHGWLGAGRPNSEERALSDGELRPEFGRHASPERLRCRRQRSGRAGFRSTVELGRARGGRLTRLTSAPEFERRREPTELDRPDPVEPAEALDRGGGEPGEAAPFREKTTRQLECVLSAASTRPEDDRQEFFVAQGVGTESEHALSGAFRRCQIS